MWRFALVLGCCLLPRGGAAQRPHPGGVPGGSVERWGMHELVFTGPTQAGGSDAAGASTVANPFEVEMSAVFTEQDTAFNFGPVAGFFDGGTSSRGRVCH